MPTKSAPRARATGYVLLLACVLSLAAGGLVIARGVDLSKAASKPWTSLAPVHDCRRDGKTMRCSAVDQDGEPLTMYLVDQPGGGANLYLIRPGRDRATILMAIGESLLFIGMSALFLGISRMRSRTAGNPWRRRTPLLVLVIPAVLAISFAASPEAPGQPRLVSLLLVGILSLGIGSVCFALLTALLTALRRKPIRIGDMTFSPDEQATAVDLIHGKIVTADDRMWIAATEIAHRRLSVATAPVVKACLLSSSPMLIAAIPGIAAPWGLWCAVGCETLMLITVPLLIRRIRSRAQRFLSTYGDGRTRGEPQGPPAEPVPNVPTAMIDEGGPSPWQAPDTWQVDG